MANWKCVLRSLAGLGFVTLLASPSLAFSYLDVPVLPERPLFRFHIADKGEQFAPGEDPSGYTLSTSHRQAFVTGTQYWTDMLSPFALNTTPLVISVLPMPELEDNASASSSVTMFSGGRTELAAALYDPTFTTSSPYLASLTVTLASYGDWYCGPMASIPQNGVFADLPSTILHEMAHALGMNGTKAELNGDTLFSGNASLWNQGLRDINGNAPLPGQLIRQESTPGGATDFVTHDYDNTPYNGVYFTGKEVQALLTVGGQQALLAWPDDSTEPPVPGVPINGWETSEDPPGVITFSPELSHIELQNALMSHQEYRNWTTLMEAELATLQDAGVMFDRRNLYGFSMYNSDLAYTSTNPYYARTPNGQWLVGQPNLTTYGTGLHVYGSRNTLHQAADLLSGGAWGLGIRLEGVENTLTIDPGVRVHASGSDGTALAVTYGRDHTITQRGDLAATGPDGVGARFDFGDNSMGNRSEYRGSWLRVAWDEATADWALKPLLSALSGPLVKRFDVTGRVAGSRAAIFISENAQVGSLNIMRGASLQGDIVSNWNIHDPRLAYPGTPTDLITTLRFGLLPDAEGRATDSPDASFAMRYDGRISGEKGLSLDVAGGQLAYNGEASLIAAHVSQGATLTGNAVYNLNADPAYAGGLFHNEGTVAPGNSLGSITVGGSYQQAPTGVLAVEFDGRGASDTLRVRDNASVEGTVHFIPLPDAYAGSVQITPFVVGGSLTGNPDLVYEAPNSPTLRLTMAPGGNLSGFSFTATRPDQAYSRYANGYSARQVGGALDSLAGLALENDLRQLIGTLDFSAPDGHLVRESLDQLAPDAYGHAALAGLERQRALSGLLLQNLHTRANSSGLSGFLRPLAGYSEQGGRGASGYRASSFGFVAGLERGLDDGLVGVHLGYTRQAVRGQNSGNSDSDYLFVGLQGRYNPASWGGFNLFGLGQGGMNRTRLWRDLDLGALRTSNTADWTGWSATGLLGAGYAWQLDPVRLEPFVALDAAMLSQPSISEHGGGLRLDLGSSTWRSLRTKAGVRVSTTPTESLPLSFQAEVAWNHELLSKTGTLKATFAETGTPFDTRVRSPRDDSLGAGLGLTWTAREDLAFALTAGSEWSGGDHRNSRSVYGDLSVRWTF